MVKRCGMSLALVCAGVLALAPPAAAQQTVNFSIGYFTVRGEDARVEGDVLNANLEVFEFEIGDFNGPAIGGEWLVALGRFFEAGAGIGFSRRTVSTFYSDFVDDEGFDIEQDLRLRLVPIAFTFRALPLGQQAPLQPYIGAGLGLINWRYSEVGDFIDFGTEPPTIFRDQFVASGTASGPLVLGGVRYAGQTFVGGGEIRYHAANADLPPGEFFGSDIDLGGWSFLATIGVRFGR